MQIDKKRFYDFLKANGITHLYHANTVQTACTFIESGGLLSRGAVEDFGLRQTSQNSDDIDKRYNIWNDIFFDIYDLHGYFPRQNYYGPVSFKFNIDLLRDVNLPELWITRDNPVHWYDGQKDADRYFRDIYEIKSEYFNYTESRDGAKRMITLRYVPNPLNFLKYLESIVIDNVNVVKNGIDFGIESKRLLEQSIRNAGMEIDLVNIRNCGYRCYCQENYSKIGYSELKRLFLLID